MKIIVAPDSYKGSLSVISAEHAMGQGILDIFPKCRVVEIPIAYGGLTNSVQRSSHQMSTLWDFANLACGIILVEPRDKLARLNDSAGRFAPAEYR